MNPAAILALLSDLYDQLTAVQAENKSLSEQLAEQQPKEA